MYIYMHTYPSFFPKCGSFPKISDIMHVDTSNIWE